MIFLFVFFFKQKTAYEMRISDWSSDVCSSDLFLVHQPRQRLGKLRVRLVGSGPALGLDEQRPARPHAPQPVVQPRRRGDQLALRRAVEVRPTKPGRALETAVLVQDRPRRDQPGPGRPVGDRTRTRLNYSYNCEPLTTLPLTHFPCRTGLRSERLGKLPVLIVGGGPALGLEEPLPPRTHATQRVVQPRRRGDQLALRRAV